MKQPFLIVILETNEQIIVNEANVVSISKHPKGHAILSMTNGEKHIVASPAYQVWENDFYVRKM